jgi:hypothetical protein
LQLSVAAIQGATIVGAIVQFAGSETIVPKSELELLVQPPQLPTPGVFVLKVLNPVRTHPDNPVGGPLPSKDVAPSVPLY